MIEVMVVLMELLLVLELVQSRAHPTCGGGHGIVCTPFCWGRGGVNLLPNFVKEALDQISIFKGDFLEKMW